MFPRRIKPPVLILLGVSMLVLFSALVFQVPFVQEKLGWRISEWRARIKYALAPPQEAVFAPDATLASMVQSTLDALVPTPTSTFTPGPTFTPTITPTPTQAPTPLPNTIQLRGVRHEYQLWNNCAPANLAMGLSYWGWPGDQTDVAAYTKPNQRDKNVMPYELANYVVDETLLNVVIRVGGDLATIKRFIASGFPVIVEKGFEGPDFSGWMGHYHLVTGYDESLQAFTVQDSYHGGPDMQLPYDDLETYWRQFNYTYLVLYPPDRESEVMALLGPHADIEYNRTSALERASQEIYTYIGRDQFFAWFNRGNNLVLLRDYASAAAAYDEAFGLYANLDPDTRPWRILWYQTGPYFAYYYSGRYYDVINLATLTLDAMSEPVLEESYYWRALAREALGDVPGAIEDLLLSVEQHPGFPPSMDQLGRLGVSP